MLPDLFTNVICNPSGQSLTPLFSYNSLLLTLIVKSPETDLLIPIIPLDVATLEVLYVLSLLTMSNKLTLEALVPKIVNAL